MVVENSKDGAAVLGAGSGWDWSDLGRLIRAIARQAVEEPGRIEAAIGAAQLDGPVLIGTFDAERN